MDDEHSEVDWIIVSTIISNTKELRTNLYVIVLCRHQEPESKALGKSKETTTQGH